MMVVTQAQFTKALQEMNAALGEIATQIAALEIEVALQKEAAKPAAKKVAK